MIINCNQHAMPYLSRLPPLLSNRSHVSFDPKFLIKPLKAPCSTRLSQVHTGDYLHSPLCLAYVTHSHLSQGLQEASGICQALATFQIWACWEHGASTSSPLSPGLPAERQAVCCCCPERSHSLLMFGGGLGFPGRHYLPGQAFRWCSVVLPEA